MKRLKRVLFLLFILFLLTVGATFFIGHFYGDSIKKFVVANLNQQLKTEVSVSQVEFSIWENFPKASVVFSDVVIYAVESKNDTLLAAKKVSAQFSLRDLYYEKYNLMGLTIEGGVCKMQTDSEGYRNYIFWNQSDSSSSSFSVTLEKVEVQDMEFYYLDYSDHIAVGFLINQLQLTGDFQNRIFNINLKSNIQHANVKVNRTILLEERSIELAVQGNINQNEETLYFSDALLSVDQINVGIEGNLNYSKTSAVNFKLKSRNTDLLKATALLPLSLRNKLSRFDIEGLASFNGSIKGAINARRAPAYNFQFSVEDGKLKDKGTALQFSDISLAGEITNGVKKSLASTELRLTSFSADLHNGSLAGSLMLQNFDTPTYAIKSQLDFELPDAIHLLNLKGFNQASGNLSADIEMSGQLNSINNYTLNDWKRAKVKGTLEIAKAGFSHKSQAQLFSNTNGKLSFNNNSVSITQLTTTLNESILNIDGKFNNLIGYFVDEEESLFVDANLSSPQINLVDFLNAEKKSNQQRESYQLTISPRVTIYLATQIDALHFHQFKLSDLTGELIVKNSRIDARAVSFRSQEGIFEGDLFVRDRGQYLTIAAQADLQNVDIHQTFKSFNNFGQSTLKAEHISGIANARVKFSSDWSKQLVVNPNSITADVSFDINGGKLTNFKPLESLSSFIEVSELQEVSFKRLQNQILVKDSKITIPHFDIHSSAIDLSLAGTHSFDNKIDYRMTLLLSELLGRKAKKSKSYQESEFGYVEDDNLGKTKLFIKMTGSVEEPKIRYDTEALKTSIQRKFVKEKNTFKSLMKEEFGLFKNDSSLKPLPPTVRKKSPFQVTFDSSYSKKKTVDKNIDRETSTASHKKGKQNKSKFGKFLDKIAKPNEEEFVNPNDD